MLFHRFFQKSWKTHWIFDYFRSKTLEAIAFPMIFNEFRLRRPSGLRPEIFVVCPVRCPAPVRRVFFVCCFFCPVRGSQKKHRRRPLAGSGFMPGIHLLSGAICLLSGGPPSIFLSGAGIRGGSGEASDFVC